jgi:hypothetical protein
MNLKKLRKDMVARLYAKGDLANKNLQRKRMRGMNLRNLRRRKNRRNQRRRRNQ